MTDEEQTAVRGTVRPGFESLQAEFAAVLAADPEHAAQLAVYHRGRLVADLWGGPELAGTTLTGVFSSSKGVAALVLALLVSRGELDVHREVRHYWPEFAAHGKGEISVHQLVSHQSGAIGVEGGLTPEELADDAAIAERLAGHRPYWRPGAAFGYHALTMGALTAEIVRRVSGLTLRAAYDAWIREPFGVDCHLGLPAAEEPRVRSILPPRPAPPSDQLPEAPDSLGGISGNRHHRAAPTVLHELPNSRLMRAGGQSSVAGLASARGLARLYAAAVTGVDGREPLLDRETVWLCGQPHTTGHDLVLGMQRTHSLGFLLSGAHLPAGTFGHDGAGGSVAFAAPAADLAFGYTRRRFAGGFAPEGNHLAAVAARAARAAG
ncbi:serine hydrolase domain-containing protein [Streptomyces sp. DSM 44915]|uniref:Serine hydrolase domain-containing protein n=1 Tax=Streptomyces chisholmiae TaxID=3075540 RepID=A0ABU2JK65_9ACTN|nr:serine hydrolase domain-containing protein [Streptomyces sp. DSM 44915]MDT0265146.1 serine hydrolase domain-containing protein [Streptomyces sp. DSM 44915]